ncbi:MAG: menaquinone biosynthesis decarboxylase [Labilithrix sp.]|nr:menaquinone biosynthesis decarboxylase [Labilithrix sp.]MCW5816010.1 menaquinone biosynthesis decarboxylase [Labilithrix sp.]
MYDGLNAFLARLEKEGELVRVRREVDPYLELAEIADRTMKAGGPALLFERPRLADGSLSKFPLLINAFGSRRRMSLALGVSDLEEHARAIAELVHTKAPGSAKELAEMARKLPALATAVPRKVSSAKCQEVVLEGDAVNLDAFPVMTTWPRDGGPFFTLPNVITRDPDTGIRNIGMYRMQRIDRKTTAMHWQIHKTGARHFRRAKELGKRLEVAVAFGGDPALTYAATAPLPDGIDEWMFAGFLRGKSVEHVRCKTVDLEVPADADFVLEGYVDPSEPLFDEGPFGDHTGYYTPVEGFPRFHVTCVTHREDAVYPATLVGPPPMEDAWLGKATERLFLPLLKMMFPEVVDMNLPVEGAFHNLCIVSIKKQFPFHAARVAHGLWGAGQMSFTKVICVVDEDVDVQNTAEVAWRLLANLDPKRDISMVDGPVDHLDHGASQQFWGGKMAIDGTKKWPEEGYQREWPDVCVSDEATRRRVDEIWSELGIDLNPRSVNGRVEPELAKRGAAPAAHATGNREMFDRIAPSYDRMNRLMTLGIDKGWRKKAIDAIRPVVERAASRSAPSSERVMGSAGPRILDLCAGTLDLAALLEEAFPEAEVVACDASEKMLQLGASKVRRARPVVGDALALPFDDASFDAVICGFGMRNLADLRRGVGEARRVLPPGGVFVTLELFQPRGATSRLLHGAGLRYALPMLGAAIANDREAYAYLAESMEGFVTREAYEQLLAAEGFTAVTSIDLTLGMAAIVCAEAKPAPRPVANGARA